MSHESRLRTSGGVTDADLAHLDRGGIWSFCWKMRDAGALTASVRAVVRRWERLTGRRYFA